MEKEKQLHIGDIVVMNDKYHVSAKNKGKQFIVRTEPQMVCGTLSVWLEGVSGCYAVDGLDKKDGESESRLKANVEKTHPHRFRRTGATYALRRGMPIEQVSRLLGHESIETTQIYLDISEKELEQGHRKYVS